MLPMYNNFNASKNTEAKYYKIGYESFEKNLPRNVSDDLVLMDRAQFMYGWDDASVKAWSQHFDLPKTKALLAVKRVNLG